jgi:hypothetical protein
MQSNHARPEDTKKSFFVYGDGGGGRKSYRLVVERLRGRKLNRDLEFCDMGSSCNAGRGGIRLGGVVGLMISGRRHDVNMAIG